MSSFFGLGQTIANAGTIIYPSERGRLSPLGGFVFGLARLPDDPAGQFSLVLKNIVRGSRYRIEFPDGSLATPTANAEGDVPAGAGTTVDLTITLDRYAAGNTRNSLTIKVRKGTAATKYLPFETQAEAQAGTVTAYIAQATDTIAV